MAVADVYDALISCRPYKKPWTHTEAVAHIQKESGTHFDPDVVAAFVGLAERFAEIADRNHRSELLAADAKAQVVLPQGLGHGAVG